MARRRQAGTMGTSVFPCLLVILLTRCSPAGCAGGDDSASHSTASTPEKPVLLNNIADSEAFVSGAEVAVIGFFQDPQSPEAEQFRLAAGQIAEVPFGLSSSAAVLSHYGASANTVALFRRVDNDRRDLDMNNRDVDAKKLTRFVRMNELRLVTEYDPVVISLTENSSAVQLVPSDLTITTDVAVFFQTLWSAIKGCVDRHTFVCSCWRNRCSSPVRSHPSLAMGLVLAGFTLTFSLILSYETAIGVMQSSLELNLLLITDKMSPKHPERMRKFRAAAELYKGKILFILLDTNLESNERVVSYFQLKKSQLPALAIFHTPDDEHDVLTLDEISIERVQDFCNRFLQRMQKKQEKSEEKPLNEEL